MGIKTLNSLSPRELSGTFLPVLGGHTTPGETTYITRSGTYYVMGNMMTVSVFVRWSACSGSGDLKISGLPFKAALESYLTVRQDDVSYSSGKQLIAMAQPDDTYIRFRAMAPSATAENVLVDSAGYLVVTGTYKIL